MDIKIQAMRVAEGLAHEKAKKRLPKDADIHPEVLRCEYLLTSVVHALVLHLCVLMNATPCTSKGLCRAEHMLYL